MSFLGKKKKIINAYFCLDLAFQEEMQLHKGVVAAQNCGVFCEDENGPTALVVSYYWQKAMGIAE